MLSITQNAVDVLRTLLSDHGARPHAGLRLMVNNDTPGEPGFQLTLVDAPTPGDQVAAADPPVYVAPTAIGALRDQILDADMPADPASLRVIPRAA